LDSGNTTVLTPGMVVNGTVRGKGPLLVQGRVDGRVLIDGEVRIAAKAALGAEVEADVVEVKGLVKGTIKGRSSVTLDAGAQVEGPIESPRIEIDPAARVKGRLVMPLQLPRGVKAPSQVRDPWAT
jgi:cytoskeletal protein CcmA (bactofilin family)